MIPCNNPKGSFRHAGENSRQGEFCFIMRSLKGMRSRSKRYLCWLRRQLPQRIINTPAEPPPCRLVIL